MTLPISRREAKRLGVLHYFTDRPCPYGHVVKRYTLSGGCYECLRLVAASEYKKQYDKQYNKDNRERIARRQRKYYLANKAKVLENVKCWRNRHPEKRAFIANSYKVRRRTQTGTSDDSTRTIFEWACRQEKVCFWCGVDCKTSYHMDHYYPLSRGGEHAIENLVIACPSCNHRKHAKDPKEFAREVARYTVNPNMLA